MKKLMICEFSENCPHAAKGMYTHCYAHEYNLGNVRCNEYCSFNLKGCYKCVPYDLKHKMMKVIKEEEK
jgi:hypothetical protein